jgi:predicted DNA binding protein
MLKLSSLKKLKEELDLTQKEEEVLLTAIHNGYYEYPRKINATELAKIIKTSKSTVIEHLEKLKIRLCCLRLIINYNSMISDNNL